MKCSKCGADITEKPLYRMGPKGGEPYWMCEDCAVKPIDPVVKDICDAIAADKPEAEGAAASLREALAFAVSMIRGGEKMSEQAEGIFAAAFSSSAGREMVERMRAMEGLLRQLGEWTLARTDDHVTKPGDGPYQHGHDAGYKCAADWVRHIIANAKARERRAKQ